MMDVGEVDVRVIGASETHALRRALLRGGSSDAVVVFDDDDLPTTFHLGAFEDESVVAVSSWYSRAYPDLPSDVGFQLRGMATVAERQGSGLGRALLRVGVAHCREHGATVVWARARISALGFYETSGFEAVGLVYTDLTTGLPHRDVVCRVSLPGSP